MAKSKKRAAAPSPPVQSRPLLSYLTYLAQISRTRNSRRQATPPLIIPTQPKPKSQSGVSRVNKEIATLIARKDPTLSRASKKKNLRISKGKKKRMEGSMIKAAAKAVFSPKL